MSAMASQITSLGLLNRLFKAKIKENIKAPRHRPLCGEFSVTVQKASHAKNVSIWWRHHQKVLFGSAKVWHQTGYNSFQEPIFIKVSDAIRRW